MRVIPTEYNGITYRSRTESRFAKWLDSIQQPFIYEPEGLATSKSAWLPDFYLPQSKLFIEIKPIIFLSEISKIIDIWDDPQLKEHEFLVATMENSSPRALAFSESRTDCGDEEQGRGWSWMANLTSKPHQNEELTGGLCFKCGALFFYGFGAWHCNGCGYYDGDNSCDRSISFDEYGHLEDRVYIGYSLVRPK